MAVQIQLRNDTAANWTSANPVLAVGEIGIETDTDQFKLGDGVTSWTSLGYGGIQGPAGDDGITSVSSPLSYDSETKVVSIDLSSYDTSTEVDGKIAALVDSAPAALDTLNELAAALGDDENFSTTVTNALAGKVDSGHSANVQGLSYTLQSSDVNKVVLMNNPSPVDVTVPSSVFAKGNRVDIIANTTAAVTFVAGSGLSLLSKDGLVALDGQYKAASIYFYNSTTAYLIGDIA